MTLICQLLSVFDIHSVSLPSCGGYRTGGDRGGKPTLTPLRRAHQAKAAENCPPRKPGSVFTGNQLKKLLVLTQIIKVILEGQFT